MTPAQLEADILLCRQFEAKYRNAGHKDLPDLLARVARELESRLARPPFAP